MKNHTTHEDLHYIWRLTLNMKTYTKYEDLQ